MFRILCILAILFSCLTVQAQDATTPDATAQPKSLAAKQAETKFNADMQKLDAEYQQKASAIKQSYVDGLKTALKTLAKKEDADPDEIAKLSAKIKEIQAIMIQSPSAVAKPQPKFGKWNDAWSGGSTLLTLKNNGIVLGSDSRPYGKWIQDGAAVTISYSGGNDYLVLMKDGKTMYGVTASHLAITYTFVGD